MPDTADLFVAALLDADVPSLERLLAPNFIFVSSGGHAQDRKHFLESLRTGRLAVRKARFSSFRETTAGEVRLLTGNGIFDAVSDTPVPSGLMRVSLVAESTKELERIVLIQLTPVISTPDCPDGNCLLR